MWPCMLCLQVAIVIALLHNQGLAHGDVSPNNILLDNRHNEEEEEEGEEGTVNVRFMLIDPANLR
jgi:tRNA A-37 threonylcarbamoyl transferase component Bud32